MWAESISGHYVNLNTGAIITVKKRGSKDFYITFIQGDIKEVLYIGEDKRGYIEALFLGKKVVSSR